MLILICGGAAGRKELHTVFEDVAERILLRRAFKDIDEVIRRLRAEFD